MKIFLKLMGQTICLLVLACFFLTSCTKVQDDEEFDQMANYKTFEVMNVENEVAKGNFYLNKNNSINYLVVPFIYKGGTIDYYLNEGLVTYGITKVSGEKVDSIGFEILDICSLYYYNGYSIAQIDLSIKTELETEETVNVNEIEFTIGEHKIVSKVDFVFNIVPDFEFVNDKNGSLFLNRNNTIISEKDKDRIQNKNNTSLWLCLGVNKVNQFLTSENDTVTVSFDKFVSQKNVSIKNIKTGIFDNKLKDSSSENTYVFNYDDLIYGQLLLYWNVEIDKLICNNYSIVLEYKLSYESKERCVVLDTYCMRDIISILENYVNKLNNVNN